MSWKCGKCDAVEGKDDVKVDVICHHCGKPLCQAHRIQILDDAFSSVDGPLSQKAWHCDECKKKYHP